MIRRVLFPALALAANVLLLPGALRAAGAAGAYDCPAPTVFAIPGGALPATAAAIRSGRLSIVALGGAATLGAAARGPTYTYPARLAAHLEAAFPGVDIAVTTVAMPREPAASARTKLEAMLSGAKPALVVWGPGGREAGRGDDLETFNAHLTETVGLIRAVGADPILMTLQYAPSIARVMNLYPYRMAVMRAGEAAGIPVLDRYDMMRYWSENFYLDLDATSDATRVIVAREVYECMAKHLAKGIADAVK